MASRKVKSGTIDVKALLAADGEFLRALARAALQEVLEAEMTEMVWAALQPLRTRARKGCNASANPTDMIGMRTGTESLLTCMGVFLSSFFVAVPCLERKGRSSSRRLRSGSAERAERCQGTEMLAQLSGLPLSVACVFAAP